MSVCVCVCEAGISPHCSTSQNLDPGLIKYTYPYVPSLTYNIVVRANGIRKKSKSDRFTNFIRLTCSTPVRIKPVNANQLFYLSSSRHSADFSFMCLKIFSNKSIICIMYQRLSKCVIHTRQSNITGSVHHQNELIINS